MYNLLISLAVALAVAAAVGLGTNFGWVAAAAPGVLALLAAYLLLARRSFKRLEGVFEVAQKELQAQRFDKALQTLQSGFSLAPWQFLVAAQLHSQIGVVLYAVKRDFDASEPHLEKSYVRHWIAQAMRAANRYRKRDLKGMREAFEAAVKASRKEGLLWAAYAWCLEKEGLHAEAVAVMSRAAKANPTDDKVKATLEALQNDRKLKLGKLWAEQWFQLHLERVPPDLYGPGARGARRVIYQRR